MSDEIVKRGISAIEALRALRTLDGADQLPITRWRITKAATVSKFA